MTPTRTALVGLAALGLAAGCSSAPSAPTSAPAPSGRPTSSSGAAPAAPGPATLRGARVLSWRLPGPVSRAVAMTDGPHVLLAGGLEPGDHSTDQVLTLDPERGVVGPPGHLAVPLHDSAGAVLGGRPTVIGGGGASELDDVQRRDPHGRWHVVAHLPGARSDLSVVAPGADGLVIGGYDGQATPTAILRTADGRRFDVAGTLPRGLRYSGVAVAHGAVWILGGEVGGSELDEVLRLDPRTGRVRPVGRMPRPLGHEAVVPVGDRLLVMGGRTSPDAVTGRMWWYATRTGSWTRAGRLPYPVADAPWVTRGAHAYLFGGETPGFTDRVTRVTWRR